MGADSRYTLDQPGETSADMLRPNGLRNASGDRAGATPECEIADLKAILRRGYSGS